MEHSSVLTRPEDLVYLPRSKNLPSKQERALLHDQRFLLERDLSQLRMRLDQEHERALPQIVLTLPSSMCVDEVLAKYLMVEVHPRSGTPWLAHASAYNHRLREIHLRQNDILEHDAFAGWLKQETNSTIDRTVLSFRGYQRSLTRCFYD